jgi:hypothetical protein
MESLTDVLIGVGSVAAVAVAIPIIVSILFLCVHRRYCKKFDDYS